MKRLILILLFVALIAGLTFSQVEVHRQKKQHTTQNQSQVQTSDVKRKNEAKAKRRREAETQRKREEEPPQKGELELKPKRDMVAKLEGKINGHDYVDLGLPSGLKWATCNIGASSPSENGDYYAWGETSPKAFYTEPTCLTYNKSEIQLTSDGIVASLGKLTMSNDAARVNWGGSWRMPTRFELEELLNRCSWTWISDGIHKGYQITGPNGCSIFIPAASYRGGFSYAGEYGRYWSASVDNGNYGAYTLRFDNSSRDVDWGSRYCGRTIRAVSD